MFNKYIIEMEHKLSFDQLPTAVTELTNEISELKRLIVEKGEDQSTESPEQFLTIQEASQLLNLTVPTLYSKVSRRELPVMKRGKRLYFSKTELIDYIKDGRKKSNSEIEREAQDYINNSQKGLSNGK